MARRAPAWHCYILQVIEQLLLRYAELSHVSARQGSSLQTGVRRLDRSTMLPSALVRG